MPILILISSDKTIHLPEKNFQVMPILILISSDKTIHLPEKNFQVMPILILISSDKTIHLPEKNFQVMPILILISSDKTIHLPEKNFQVIPILILISNDSDKTSSINTLIDLFKKIFLCDMCPKRLKSRKFLQIHKHNAHTGRRYGYLCPVCAHRFEKPNKVRAHARRVHGLPDAHHPPIVRVQL
ncbi:hypothetical protein MSG28_014838 [Choristoneura fumiferana]|uniref:Uncharacterized protein n=1 Tax=Choristoneura fumiferana TaxID=7141 RepID=A0ACC0JTH6_CHOFU|nr:hypothetical protein MSG28_014838 [Choristoneura fumiferana]